MVRSLGPVALAGVLLASCSAASGSSDREAAAVGGPTLDDGDEAEVVGPGFDAAGVRAAGVTAGRVPLQGSDEVPGPGVPTASGWADVAVIAERNEVCVEILLRDLDQPSAAHLHEGAAGQSGEVVLALPAPTEGDGSVEACVTAAPKVIDRLLADLSAFYVNIHSVAAPEGALRGQLG